MTTIESLEFSPRKSEPKSEDSRTPTLDLFNVLTLAEDIAAEPDGPQAKRFAKQIIEHCELEDVTGLKALAEQIRAASLPDERADLANQIALEVGAILAEREDESRLIASAM